MGYKKAILVINPEINKHDHFEIVEPRLVLCYLLQILKAIVDLRKPKNPFYHRRKFSISYLLFHFIYIYKYE